MSSMCLRTRATNALRARSLVVVRGLEQAPEVLERELGVDGDEPAAQADDRIDPLAAPEGVLEGEVGGGQYLRQEIAQEELPEAAAELRGAQDIVQRGDVAPHLVDLGGRLAQLAEALLHLAHHARGVVEPLADGGLAALRQLEALAQAVVHLPREQSQLLTDELPLTGQRLPQLSPEGVELLLQEA